jgi:iron complex outermembrane receptor protein
MKMLSKKPALVLMLTMSTASFYFAQGTQDTLIRKGTNIDEVVLIGVADIAKDRKTPVAVSTIKEAQIVEKLGNQELPEVLNTTPSVYATKGSGGFGDSNLIIIGFDQKNIAVMVNGVPVNDMESGAVYWSNWSGLSDVTSAMQVQRGLGSSKLAIASVGGTVNLLTRAADKKEGGTLTAGLGNDGYIKSLFSYNTGESENGWSSSFLMSRTAGSTYVDNTEFEGYNYYFALGYQPNKKHDFQFRITGAPQNHDKRTNASTIANYIKFNPDQDNTPNRRYNPDWVYLNGEAFSMRTNYYHKPTMSANWDWNISDKSKLNTVGYASFGRGGGSGELGKVGGKSLSQWGTDANGQLNLDQI